VEDADDRIAIVSHESRKRIGALQLGSEPAGTSATLEKLFSRCDEIRAQQLELLVLPEALLGGYPKGSDFGARVGYRTPLGRESFRKYWSQAIAVPGPETNALCDFARNTGASLVVGAIERKGSTLYCAAVLINSTGVLVGVHRKLVPTAMERLIWGQGDGSGLVTMETGAGRVAVAICWENYMPLYRSAMYAKQPAIWCAPTVDDRNIWQASMRHIAYEARCFVVSACQFSANAKVVLDEQITLRDRPLDTPLIRGGSCIVSPFGEVSVGPIYDREELLCAEIDLDDLVRARFDLDITGHYARPDLFELIVTERS
jgi:nitrilase